MSKVIVSLTSYPKRIHVVHEVIKSLWNQTRCADKIILYLSIEEFPEKEANLPKELLEMIGIGGFDIEWVGGNLKSHKKYYYSLQKYSQEIVITVDDDKEYAKTLISDLLDGYRNFPKAICARCARIIIRKNKDLENYQEWDLCKDKHFELPNMNICAIGAGGVLYPPNCALQDWFNQKNILELAEKQDDLWLKFNEIVNEIPVAYIKPTQEDKQIVGTNETALSMMNLYNGENDVCINKLCEYVRKDNPVIFHNWLASLMTKEEFVLEKKNYYFTKIRKQFENRKDKSIYLYGAGKVAKRILCILGDGQLLFGIEAILVSDKQNNPDELFGIKVRQVEELDKTKPFYVIYGVGTAYQSEIELLLQDYLCCEMQLDIAGLVRYYEK